MKAFVIWLYVRWKIFKKANYVPLHRTWTP
jgi:hypothetical protein